MLVNDTKKQEYRVALEGDHFAVAKYSIQGKVMEIYSTRVPDELQGKGYGKVMMEPYCPRLRSRVIRWCLLAVMWRTI